MDARSSEIDMTLMELWPATTVGAMIKGKLPFQLGG